MTKNHLKNQRNPKAFTLVELIISMLIFTIFVGIASTTYIYVSRALRHAAEVRSVYAETRFLMDKITQDVRLYTIDYACYAAAGDPYSPYGTTVYGECSESGLSDDGQTSSLHLISADGTHRMSYRFEDGGFSILELDYDETLLPNNPWTPSEGYYSGFQLFETQRVDLDYVQFMIKPLRSPYENPGEDASQYQPSVNVVIAARSTSTLLPEVLQVEMQSTIASRVYGVEF